MSEFIDFKKIEKSTCSEEFNREMVIEDETGDMISLTEMAKEKEECVCKGGSGCSCSDVRVPIDQDDGLVVPMDKVEQIVYSKNNMGQHANQGFTRDDSKTTTRLLYKNWSPMIVRKYYVSNWPCYIGLITDCNLNDLDQVVMNIINDAEKYGFLDGNIQSCRNFCGFMSDEIDKHYDSIKKGSVEGISIAWYVDKCFISSLSKDYMVHKSCRDEFYSILKILPHI